MYNLLENIFASKELYVNVLNPVCAKYNITQTEMVVLLFLADNPQHDTATDIVERRRLTKSSVSMAVRTLQERGFITGNFVAGNHRSIHLKLCEPVKAIVEEGRMARNTCLSILMDGFTTEEAQNLKNYFERVTANINAYHKKLHLTHEENGGQQPQHTESRKI